MSEAYDPTRPLIVQSDQTVLLEADHPDATAVRDAISPFAELVKSPEHIHTYRITPLSLWNAAASGISSGLVLETLTRLSKFPIPESLSFTVEDQISRYGRLKLVSDPEGLVLTSEDPHLLTELEHTRGVAPHLLDRTGPSRIRVRTLSRGLLKQALLKAGHPVEDLAGYVKGAPLTFSLRDVTRPDPESGDPGTPFTLRPYQGAAVDSFWAGGRAEGGSGVICLPCGAGKTLVGLGAMVRAQSHTLILCSSTTAVHQWIQEILARTTLQPDRLGEYTGERKEILPVTVSTYQILTSHMRKADEFVHLRLLSEHDWGLILYDEVHLLPAPIFRVTAEIQARRRLGLTATLVREDGREDDVFALIGPKRYDSPWRELEREGWIATAECTEIRVDLPDELRAPYSVLTGAEQARIAAENPAKLTVVRELLARHEGEGCLVIGQYLSQLTSLADSLKAPLITGKTAQRERERLFAAFRRGEVATLVVSRVANFAIDLPEAAVAIEVSGLYGSRQEEAQRLGRILRPKADSRPASFYAVVTQDTVEAAFAQKRQLFLVEQGYRYRIGRGSDLFPVQDTSSVSAPFGRPEGESPAGLNLSAGSLRAGFPPGEAAREPFPHDAAGPSTTRVIDLIARRRRRRTNREA